MTSEIAIELCQSTVMQAVLLGGPILLAALAVGLAVGLVQALTQVQDQSLTFVPKLAVLTLLFLLLLPWGLSLLTEFAVDLIRNIPGTI